MTHTVGGNTIKVRTLLVVPWDEVRGGVVCVADNLTRYLLGRGHDVTFFHPGKTLLLKRRMTKLGFDGVTLRLMAPSGTTRRPLRILVFPLLFTLSLLQLLWFLHRQRIQVINVHYVTDESFYFAVCSKVLSIRLVTSIHGRDAFLHEKPRIRYSRPFRFLIDASDLIVLPSRTYRNKLLQAFPEVESRAIAIHNGINPSEFRPADDRHHHGMERYILCVAEMREYKGIDVLLRAVQPILAGDPVLSVVLAGDGPMRQELEDLAGSLHIESRTRFLGRRGAVEIAALLNGCELFVLPSREEPFGIVLIEAMACRKAVVASNIGGIPEVVEHEQTGILVEPENPAALEEGLRRLLADSALRNRLAENGYRRAIEHFCLNHTGAAYEKALTSLAGDDGCRSAAACEPV
jgi:glycosyltransferase involved in cell wall biosynthesis